MRHVKLVTATLFFVLSISQVSANETRLLRNPDISATHITFVYANDIWITDLSGQNTKRLTSFPGTETIGSMTFSR